MRFPGSRFVMPATVILVAAASASLLVAIAPTAHAHIAMDYCPASAPCTPPPPSPTPVPTPTPVNAFISLDVTSGPPETQITVSGSAFLANQSTSLYWDLPIHVAGASNADANGNFSTKVRPFAGDAPGVHKLCASVLPNPCANFNLQAVAASPSPSPSASPSPSPDASPSPAASPGGSPSPTPVAATVNGLDLMMKPPFVILPIIGVLGLLIALGYWILSLVTRPRQQTLKSVAVTHIASRPDYSAGFGTPPPAPAPAAPQPSAWTDPVVPPAPAPPAATPPAEEAASALPPQIDDTVQAPPPDETIPAAPDEPPDLPEPADY